MHTFKKIDRVLLVDDDEVSCYINHTILQRAGYDGAIDMVHDGTDALEYLKHYADASDNDSSTSLLMLLDINMPVMSGLELLEVLADEEIANNLQLHIAILSSASTQEDLSKVASFQLSDFINKPLTELKVERLFSGLEIIKEA